MSESRIIAAALPKAKKPGIVVPPPSTREPKVDHRRIGLKHAGR